MESWVIGHIYVSLTLVLTTKYHLSTALFSFESMIQNSLTNICVHSLSAFIIISLGEIQRGVPESMAVNESEALLSHRV